MISFGIKTLNHPSSVTLLAITEINLNNKKMMARKISPIFLILILSFKVKLFHSASDPRRWIDPTHPGYEGSGSEPDTNEVTSLSGKIFPWNHTIRNK